MLRLFSSAFRPDGLSPSTREAFVEIDYRATGDLGMRDAGKGRTDRLRSASISAAERAAVIQFWLEAGPGQWFAQMPDFDRRFRDRFLPLHEKVAGAGLGKALTADESFALLVLLDQFPRNAFRGTPRMYATDPAARAIASAALTARHDQAFDAGLRIFFYLPFAHSEDLADQDRSVALNSMLDEPAPSHAKRHRDIIRRFGRFPHRNPILGRQMTPAEQRFLNEGGYAG